MTRSSELISVAASVVNESPVPVTVVRVAPNTVMQVKTKERDGYDAVVLGILKPRTDGHTVTLYSAEFKIDGT